MGKLKQIDCFNINMKFWKVLAIWPASGMHRFYQYYYKIFIAFFVILNNFLFTINFYYLPRHLDLFVEEMIFYFTELAVTSKVLTFIFLHEKITKVLNILESDTFQPHDKEGSEIIDKSKKFNIRYWKIVAAVSVTSNLTHILTPLITHLFFNVKLDLPVCSYSFLSENTTQTFIYPLYWYQALSIHIHMLYNVNVDTFILGVLTLTIAQLDILDVKLRRVTENDTRAAPVGNSDAVPAPAEVTAEADSSTMKLNDTIIHFDDMGKFCNLIEDVFSVTMFIQFSMASCLICVVLFRFTLPAPWQYFVFLATYMFIMIIQILVPCWFGTRIEEKSQLLSLAVYNCDWTTKSRYFKSSLRLFVERANKPLSITAGKMFPLSLTTFTSIMNTSYSFFTLLRHMQSRQG